MPAGKAVTSESSYAGDEFKALIKYELTCRTQVEIMQLTEVVEDATKEEDTVLCAEGSDEKDSKDEQDITQEKVIGEEPNHVTLAEEAVALLKTVNETEWTPAEVSWLMAKFHTMPYGL